MSPIAPIDRRAFLASVAAVGGSLALGSIFRWTRGRSAGTAAPEITAWIVIEPDDTVIVRIARSEMGQGSFTALPMLVAEGLECDWSKVKAEFVPPEENLRRNRAWGDMSTGGSRSIRASHDYLRKAGATAREMLIGAAAGEVERPRLRMPGAQQRDHPRPDRTHRDLRADRGGGRAGAGAEGDPAQGPQGLEARRHAQETARNHRQGPGQADLRDRRARAQHAARRGDPVAGVRRQAEGGRRAPDRRRQGRAQSRQAGRCRRGGRRPLVAGKKAVEALDLVWDDGGNAQVTSRSIEEFLRSGLAAKDAGVGRKEGDVAAGLAQAATRVEAEYAVPFLGHATLEPQNCTAHVTRDKVEIWAPTQNGEATLAAAAQAAGVPARNVVVHKCMLGGGFGRRGAMQDFVSLAVRIARQVERPVKVIWTREEDTRHDFYRPVAMAGWRPGSTQRACRSPGTCG